MKQRYCEKKGNRTNMVMFPRLFYKNVEIYFYVKFAVLVTRCHKTLLHEYFHLNSDLSATTE